jgi:hypothetical protein
MGPINHGMKTPKVEQSKPFSYKVIISGLLIVIES